MMNCNVACLFTSFLELTFSCLWSVWIIRSLHSSVFQSVKEWMFLMSSTLIFEVEQNKGAISCSLFCFSSIFCLQWWCLCEEYIIFCFRLIFSYLFSISHDAILFRNLNMNFQQMNSKPHIIMDKEYCVSEAFSNCSLPFSSCMRCNVFI